MILYSFLFRFLLVSCLVFFISVVLDLQDEGNSVVSKVPRARRTAQLPRDGEVRLRLWNLHLRQLATRSTSVGGSLSRTRPQASSPGKFHCSFSIEMLRIFRCELFHKIKTVVDLFLGWALVRIIIKYGSISICFLRQSQNLKYKCSVRAKACKRICYYFVYDCMSHTNMRA